MMSIILTVFGVIATWYFSRAFYKKAQCDTPEWAKQFISKLPKEEPTIFELQKIFQETLNTLKDSGVKFDPLTNYVACPNCFAPSEQFICKHKFGNDQVDYILVTCPHCGWSELVEV